MSFSSTIDKNARHNFLENAIMGTIDIYTVNTYLAPIHKGLRLVFDKRDSIVFEQDFQPLQCAQSHIIFVVPKLISTIGSNYAQCTHLMICYILACVMAITTHTQRPVETGCIDLCDLHSPSALTPH